MRSQRHRAGFSGFKFTLNLKIHYHEVQVFLPPPTFQRRSLVLSPTSSKESHHNSNFENGISFTLNNGNVNLSCNDFLGTQDIGLAYSNDAVTGWPVDRGNQWLGNYNQWGAQHLLPSMTMVFNQFRARPNTTEWPPTLDPSNPGQWFGISQVVPQCPFIDNCETPPGLLAPDNPSELDNMIAQGNFTTAGGLRWDMEKYLYGRLMHDEITWQGNNLMEGFVAARQNTAIGQFHAIGEGIRSLFQIDATTQTQLDGYLDAIEAKRAQTAALDQEMTGAQGSGFEALLAQRQQLEAEIAALLQSVGEMFNSLHTARVQQAEVLLTANNAIATSAPYEANEKTFFNLYLNTIGKDSETASASQLNDLYAIASQCPPEGGRAVYWAIGLYGHLTGDVLEVQDCAGMEERSQDANTLAESLEKAFFSLTPNPASLECKASYHLSVGSVGKLVITNLLGVRQSTYLLTMGNNNVTIGGLPAGTYFVTLLVDGAVVQTQKLIIN